MWIGFLEDTNQEEGESVNDKGNGNVVKCIAISRKDNRNEKKLKKGWEIMYWKEKFLIEMSMAQLFCLRSPIFPHVDKYTYMD